MPERSAASCSRRLATIGRRPISPITAARPGVRSPSSTAHRRSSSRDARTITRRAGSRPYSASPAPYRSARFRHHSTGLPSSIAGEERCLPPPARRSRDVLPPPCTRGRVGEGAGTDRKLPNRATMPAAKAAAAAPSSSSPPCPRISCTAPSARPPPGKARSISAVPNGNTPCRDADCCSSRRTRSRSAAISRVGDMQLPRTGKRLTCSACFWMELKGLSRRPRCAKRPTFAASAENLRPKPSRHAAPDNR